MAAHRIRYVDYQPAAVGSGETVALHAVRKGERVALSVMRKVPADGATTSVVSIGDTGSGTRYFDSLVLSGANGDIVDSPFQGGGTYGWLEVGAGQALGYLYTAADKIQATYTPGATPGTTVPRVTVAIESLQIWP